MHSYEHMLKDVEEKLSYVGNALDICENEKSNLSNNLTSIKQAVETSFKRHIGTLQCRAKWLVCHADSIYHLKEGSLNQQIAELEMMSTELKSCLDSSQQHLNENEEEMKLTMKNVLDSISHISLQPCEKGSMVFVGDDNRLEEMIISYGDIDAHERSLVECDLLSDEGIFVVECPSKQQDAIEMKVKSNHLIAQSANSEKEDFERIEMDVYDCSGIDVDKGVQLLQPSQGDSGIEEETESSDFGEWLHRTTIVDQVVVPENTSIHFVMSDNISLEEESNHVSNSTKVPLWLKKCEEPNPWIRSTNWKGTPTLLKENHFDNNNFLVRSLKDNSSDTSFGLDSKEKCITMDNMNGILLAANSKFLQRNAEGLTSSLSSLNSNFSFLGLMERKELQQPQNESSTKPSNIENFNNILKDDNSIFLRGGSVFSNSSSMAFHSEGNISRSLEDNNLDTYLFSQDKNASKLADVDLASSGVKSNISHMRGILDAQANEFLIARDDGSRGLLNTNARKTNAINHLQNLENKPDRMFLRSGSKSKTFDASMCEWLRGSASVENCAQCLDFNECEMNGTLRRLGSKWVKTATDW